MNLGGRVYWDPFLAAWNIGKSCHLMEHIWLLFLSHGVCPACEVWLGTGFRRHSKGLYSQAPLDQHSEDDFILNRINYVTVGVAHCHLLSTHLWMTSQVTELCWEHFGELGLGLLTQGSVLVTWFSLILKKH